MDFGGIFQYSWDQIPFIFLALVISFTLHEFAHAYTADKFGDPTPRSMGRVTLNPRMHLDIWGTILIFLVGFGWAKPVMIRPGNFKKPRLMGVIVSFAGPFANLLLAFIGLLVYFALYHYGWIDSLSPGSQKAIELFLNILIGLNALLFIFNLLPLPPLDGYRILSEFLPIRTRLKLQEYEQWAFYFFLLIVFITPVYKVTLGPILALKNPLVMFLGNLANHIFPMT
jgi:Zn-dependent protease